MTTQTQTIVSKVNAAIKNKPLIYFCREAERAIGLEHILENYHICCIESSDMVQQLKSRGVSVFCLEDEGVELMHKSTGNLLSQSTTQQWIRSISKNGLFYGITFIPTNTLQYKIEQLGGTLLGNSYELHQLFENKISQFSLLQQNAIRTPKIKTGFMHELTFDEIISEFSDQFVLQSERAHTGSGTHIKPTKEEFERLSDEYSGNMVKLSSYINGIPLTVNVCVYNKHIYIGGLQYQITGIPELTASGGSTVGNDFDWLYTKEISDALLVDLTQEISKVGKMMIEHEYQGLFGLDLLIQGEEAYLIEINARQSANIPFQTQLELRNTEHTPLLLLHIAALLGITEPVMQYEHMARLNGSQIFLRAKQDREIEQTLRSGVYRLQSDNAAQEWSSAQPVEKDGVIYIDEERDKPLILQKNGYRIEDAHDSGFLIHFQNERNQKRMYDELCRIQFNHGILKENQQIAPWILEALLAINDMI